MKKRFSVIVAGGLVAACYFAAGPKRLSEEERKGLAGQFKFARAAIEEVGDHPPYKTVRRVHPSLQRISAWISSVGASATLADLDQDGLANDIISVDPRTDLVTVSCAPVKGNRYKPFTLERESWGRGYDVNALAPTGTLAGDFNDDGLPDILVYFWGRTPLLYLRQAGPAAEISAASFRAEELSATTERWYSDCALQADLDGDGRLDLIFGNYFQDGARVLDEKASGTETMHQGKAKALNGGFKHVFLREGGVGGGGVRFHEVKNVFPEIIARGWTVAMGAADLDGDLLPELYFSHDFGPDRLMHNRSTPGKLSFVELRGERGFLTPKSCVLGQDSFKGMGCDFADVNGDGVLDIYVSNIAAKFGLMESHFLWQSTGNIAAMKEGVAPYFQNSEKLGLSRSGFAWDARLADFNNDGTLEAMQACGFIKGQINRWPELQALGTSNNKIIHNPRFWPSFKPGADLCGSDANPFFVRATDGRYYDIAPEIGMGEPQVSRGIAIGDVDGDGRLDFVTANQWGPSYFFHNESASAGAFLQLRIVDELGMPVIGASVEAVTADGRKRVAQVDGGSGHSGHRSAEIHIGLGDVAASSVVNVAVKWRSMGGRIETRSVGLTPGRHTISLKTSSAAQVASR
jgi:enediyne biosynthesis protein E4